MVITDCSYKRLETVLRESAGTERSNLCVVFNTSSSFFFNFINGKNLSDQHFVKV